MGRILVALAGVMVVASASLAAFQSGGGSSAPANLSTTPPTPFFTVFFSGANLLDSEDQAVSGIRVVSAAYQGTGLLSGVVAYVYQIINTTGFALGGSADPFTLNGWDSAVPTLAVDVDGDTLGDTSANVSVNTTQTGAGAGTGFSGFNIPLQDRPVSAFSGNSSIPGGPITVSFGSAPLLGSGAGNTSHLFVLFAPSSSLVTTGSIDISVSGNPVSVAALTPAPEPISMGLFALGAAGIVAARRRLGLA